MPSLTKRNLPFLVDSALARSGLQLAQHIDLTRELLRNRAIEFDEPPARRSDEFMEMIVIRGRSRQAIRTAGGHLNVFALAGVVLSAAAATPTLACSTALLVALLGACTITLSPDQAAFIAGLQAATSSNSIPTAKAVAERMGAQNGGPSPTVDGILETARQLKALGMPLTIGDPPNHILRHSEWVVTFPGA